MRVNYGRPSYDFGNGFGEGPIRTWPLTLKLARLWSDAGCVALVLGANQTIIAH